MSMLSAPTKKDPTGEKRFLRAMLQRFVSSFSDYGQPGMEAPARLLEIETFLLLVHTFVVEGKRNGFDVVRRSSVIPVGLGRKEGNKVDLGLRAPRYCNLSFSTVASVASAISAASPQLSPPSVETNTDRPQLSVITPHPGPSAAEPHQAVIC